MDEGANVDIWAYTSSANQLWIILEKDSGIYSFKARHSGLCLDINGLSATNGANIRQMNCNDSESQKFTLSDLADIYAISLTSVNGNFVKIYNSPVDADGIVIDFSNVNNPKGFAIIDLKGTIIYSQNSIMSSLIHPDIKLLPGIYFLRVLGDNQFYNTKFLVQ